MPALTGTLAQQRVLVAVQAALGAMYQVEWITRADTGMTLLFVQHRRSQRAAALHFDNPQTGANPTAKDCLGSIASPDKRAAEIAALAATRPEEARTLVQDHSEPGETTALHHALDAALMALAAWQFEGK